MSGVIEGGIALLIALAGAFVLFGQIRENAKRNEEDIQAIKVMIEKYQQTMHDTLTKSMSDMKELFEVDKNHQKESFNAEISHLKDLISMSNNELRDDIKRVEERQYEVNKFRERLAIITASVKSLHRRLDIEIPTLLDEDKDI